VTISEFRAIPTYVARIRELLSDPTMQVALTTLLDFNKPAEALDGDPEIVSVRRHSRGVGWDNCLRALLSLGELREPEKKEGQEVPTYGTGISADTDFSALETPDSDILQAPLP
jgi:hypothetical protein